MHVVKHRTLREFWSQPGRGDAERGLTDWYHVADRADWATPADVKAAFRSASIVGDRVVFNIAGNKYPLVVLMKYQQRRIYIRFIGRHDEYDRIDVRQV
jgi:mRNA interferase HigB